MAHEGVTGLPGRRVLDGAVLLRAGLEGVESLSSSLLPGWSAAIQLWSLPLTDYPRWRAYTLREASMAA